MYSAAISTKENRSINYGIADGKKRINSEEIKRPENIQGTN